MGWGNLTQRVPEQHPNVCREHNSSLWHLGEREAPVYEGIDVRWAKDCCYVLCTHWGVALGPFV